MERTYLMFLFAFDLMVAIICVHRVFIQPTFEETAIAWTLAAAGWMALALSSASTAIKDR